MATVTCDGAPENTANCGETLDVWMKALLTRLPGAVPATVRCELQAAVREFYMQSSAWRDTIGGYRLRAGQNLVFLNPVDAYANVKHVLGAYLDFGGGDRYELKKLVRPPVGTDQERPRAYYPVEPYTLQLYPTPLTDYGRVLYVYAALVPAVGAERLPQIAVSHHFEPILYGSLSRLYGMPNKPWSNPELGLYFERQFRRRIAQARDEANRGHTNADAPWRFPFFA